MFAFIDEKCKKLLDDLAAYAQLNTNLVQQSSILGQSYNFKYNQIITEYNRILTVKIEDYLNSIKVDFTQEEDRYHIDLKYNDLLANLAATVRFNSGLIQQSSSLQEKFNQKQSQILEAHASTLNEAFKINQGTVSKIGSVSIDLSEASTIQDVEQARGKSYQTLIEINTEYTNANKKLYNSLEDLHFDMNVNTKGRVSQALTEKFKQITSLAHQKIEEIKAQRQAILAPFQKATATLEILSVDFEKEQTIPDIDSRKNGLEVEINSIVVPEVSEETDDEELKRFSDNFKKTKENKISELNRNAENSRKLVIQKKINSPIYLEETDGETFKEKLLAEVQTIRDEILGIKDLNLETQKELLGLLQRREQSIHDEVLKIKEKNAVLEKAITLINEFNIDFSDKNEEQSIGHFNWLNETLTKKYAEICKNLNIDPQEKRIVDVLHEQQRSIKEAYEARLGEQAFIRLNEMTYESVKSHFAGKNDSEIAKKELSEKVHELTTHLKKPLSPDIEQLITEKKKLIEEEADRQDQDIVIKIKVEVDKIIGLFESELENTITQEEANSLFQKLWKNLEEPQAKLTNKNQKTAIESYISETTGNLYSDRIEKLNAIAPTLVKLEQITPKFISSHYASKKDPEIAKGGLLKHVAALKDSLVKTFSKKVLPPKIDRLIAAKNQLIEDEDNLQVKKIIDGIIVEVDKLISQFESDLSSKKDKQEVDYLVQSLQGSLHILTSNVANRDALNTITEYIEKKQGEIEDLIHKRMKININEFNQDVDKKIKKTSDKMKRMESAEWQPLEAVVVDLTLKMLNIKIEELELLKGTIGRKQLEELSKNIDDIFILWTNKQQKLQRLLSEIQDLNNSYKKIFIDCMSCPEDPPIEENSYYSHQKILILTQRQLNLKDGVKQLDNLIQQITNNRQGIENLISELGSFYTLQGGKNSDTIHNSLFQLAYESSKFINIIQQQQQKFTKTSNELGNITDSLLPLAQVQKGLINSKHFKDLQEYGQDHSIKKEQIKKYIMGIRSAGNINDLIAAVHADPQVNDIANRKKSYSMRANTGLNLHGFWYEKGRSTTEDIAFQLEDELDKLLQEGIDKGYLRRVPSDGM